VMDLQAGFWYKQCRFEEAASEASRAAEVYESIGATRELGSCRVFLRNIEGAVENHFTSA